MVTLDLLKDTHQPGCAHLAIEVIDYIEGAKAPTTGQCVIHAPYRNRVDLNPFLVAIIQYRGLASIIQTLRTISDFFSSKAYFWAKNVQTSN